jgi:hypothetical protein
MNHDNDGVGPSSLSRGLVVALVLGAIVFLGLVVWILRTGGSIWG